MPDSPTPDEFDELGGETPSTTDLPDRSSTVRFILGVALQAVEIRCLGGIGEMRAEASRLGTKIAKPGDDSPYRRTR